MVSSEHVLIIEAPPPGWRFRTVALAVSFVVSGALAVPAVRYGGLPSVAALVAAVFCLGSALVVADRASASYRLEVAGGVALVTRRSVFLRRSWRCRESELAFGDLDSAPDQFVRDGIKSEFGEHGFLEMYAGSRRIKFMDGHAWSLLGATRRQIRDWYASRPSAQSVSAR